jgi:hypothetical protein
VKLVSAQEPAQVVICVALVHDNLARACRMKSTFSAAIQGSYPFQVRSLCTTAPSMNLASIDRVTALKTTQLPRFARNFATSIKL